MAPIKVSNTEKIKISPCCNSNSFTKVCKAGGKRQNFIFFKTPEPYLSSKFQNLKFLQNSRTLDFFKTPEH